MEKIAIYSGTFDPLTHGHVDLVKRAARLFDVVIVAVAANKQKKPLFTLEERVRLAKQVLMADRNVEVEGFSGLLTDFAQSKGAAVIVRGLRVISDFDHEFQMASVNRTILPELETIFLTPADRYTYVSSSLVREIAAMHGDVSAFVPTEIQKALEDKFA